jgi:hypothetical protein
MQRSPCQGEAYFHKLLKGSRLVNASERQPYSGPTPSS